MLRKNDREQKIVGRVLVKAEDGGLLVMSPDGTLSTVPPEELVSHAEDTEEFKPLSSSELAARLLDELPAGFEVHATKHYLIAYNTSKAYAQWCGALFERLYNAFTNYWTRQGFELRTPEFPLVAVVFADQASYGRFAHAELGEAAASIIGYYSLASNRMTMYDLTGMQGLRAAGDRRGSPAQINQMLSRPDAERTVATVIHEATHQIAFNCGLQTRYADIPLWISEGIAVYFETPDLSSPKGWRNFGSINQVRLAAFSEYAERRPADSLRTLIADDAPLSRYDKGRRRIRRGLGLELFPDPPAAQAISGLSAGAGREEAAHLGRSCRAAVGVHSGLRRPDGARYRFSAVHGEALTLIRRDGTAGRVLRGDQ